MKRSALLLPLAACVALMAQMPRAIQVTATAGIQATGTARISVNPDQAQLTVGVVTQGNTAQDAAQQNATQTTAVINALKSVLGMSGTLQTIGYSVTPRYSNTQTPVVIGYIASNTLQVTTTDLSLAGRLIDAASQAGANNVGGLTFGLQNPEPVVQQALTQASRTALAHAGAIASGLGAKVGAVTSAQEGSAVAPIYGDATATTTPTPVQTGTVSVSATVTITAQLIAQ